MGKTGVFVFVFGLSDNNFGHNKILDTDFILDELEGWDPS